MPRTWCMERPEPAHGHCPGSGRRVGAAVRAILPAGSVARARAGAAAGGRGGPAGHGIGRHVASRGQAHGRRQPVRATARRGPARDPDTVGATMIAIRHGMEKAYEYVADPRFAGVPPFWQRRDTVYTAVVADGMRVSLISSVFMAFGSGIWAAGAFMQNRGFGFSLDPAHPNVVQGRKRPFHTIIPALVRGRGRTEVVFAV